MNIVFGFIFALLVTMVTTASAAGVYGFVAATQQDYQAYLHFYRLSVFRSAD